MTIKQTIAPMSCQPQKVSLLCLLELPWSKVCSSDNWTYSSLDFLGGRKGLTDEFNYQMVCLYILSGILHKATNMKTIDYANAYLFEPLGIPMHINYYAETAEEHKQFTIGKLPKTNSWFCDTEGLGTPGYGLLRIIYMHIYLPLNMQNSADRIL